MIHRMRGEESDAQRAQSRSGSIAAAYCAQAFGREPVNTHRLCEITTVACQSSRLGEPSDRVGFALGLTDGGAKIRMLG
ncbi:MAG: hypothetical protein AB7E55_25275 [Pigmentiphaga sp.]